MSDFDIKDYLARKRAALAAAPAPADEGNFDIKDYLARKRAALGQPPPEPTAQERNSAIDIELRPDDKPAPPEPSMLDRVGSAIDTGAGVVAKGLGNFADTWSLGGYRILRDDLPAAIRERDPKRFIFGGETPQTKAEDQFNEAHPFFEGMTKGPAYFVDGPLKVASKTVEAGARYLGGLAKRAAPELVAKGLGYLSKAPAPVKQTAAALGAYGTQAPVISAISPEAAGHRLDAFTTAAAPWKDPRGWAMAAGTTIPLVLLHGGVMNSEGAKQRELLQTEGGATVGPFTSGKGGTFGPTGELADLETRPADDTAIGYAGKEGGKIIEPELARSHETKHGYGYREGPALVAKAADNLANVNREGRENVRDVTASTDAQIRDQEMKALLYAHDRAAEVLAAQDALVQEKGATPYAKMEEQVEGTRAHRQKQDATALVKSVRKAMNFSGTPPDVRKALRGEYKLMQRWKVEPPEPEPSKAADELAVLVAARENAQKSIRPGQGSSGVAAAELDKLIAAKQAEVDAPPPPKQVPKYMMPAYVVNGHRGTFRDLSGIGKTKVRLARTHPLRQAYREFKKLTDQGPYKGMNEVFSDAAQVREKAREGLGLKGYVGDRPGEIVAVKGRMLKSMTDPTAFPNGTPPEVDMGEYQRKIDAANTAQQAAKDQAEMQKRQALDEQAAIEARVAAGNEDARRARAQLGLNLNIPLDPETDVMKIKGTLIHPTRSTVTSGGARGYLDDFRDENPRLRRATYLPDFVNAKADLGFHLGSLQHGGMFNRLAPLSPGIAGVGLGLGALTHSHKIGAAPIATALGLAAIANRKAIAGRLLYTPAKLATPEAVKSIARAQGIGRGATINNGDDDILGRKAEAYIELQKQEQR